MPPDGNQAVRVTESSPLESVLTVLRCGSCRFAALYFVPFYAAVVQARGTSFDYTLLSAAYWMVYSLSVEITNRLADRVEDAVNRPERTRLCVRVGWDTLGRVEVAGWCLVAALDVAWLGLNDSLALAALLALGIVLGITYSRGPRLARTRFVGLVVLNLVFGGVFVLGWAAATPFPHGTQWRLPLSFLPLAGVVGTFVVTFAGIKDITDRRGDLAVGYRSAFVDMLERNAAVRLWTLAAMPFLLVLAFTLMGLLPLRLLALTMFAPLSGYVVLALLHSVTPRERMVVRELFYSYWLVFSSTALVLFIPRLSLLCAATAAIAYWALATRWLHWTQPVTLSEIGRLPRTTRTRSATRIDATAWRA